MKYCGYWNNVTYYDILDCVQYRGFYFVARFYNINVNPLADNIDAWLRLN